MSSITAQVGDALASVTRPAAFCVVGTEAMPAPGLVVEGVGPIALPLLPVQAEQLIAAAQRAPHGRGKETLIDLTVRRTWQIEAGRVRIAGKHWPKTLQAITDRVQQDMGLIDPIDAELYKLLVYDEGSFFVPHRDTEKSPGMFATLVLALPSISTGGELIVRHRDQSVKLDLGGAEPDEVVFAAFYADCVHEVLPVTEGHRLVLVYNLLRRGAGSVPRIPDYDGEQNVLATLFTRWAQALRQPDNAEPQKLIYTLEHAYTPAELGFGSLKGADAGLAAVVAAAADAASCDVHLALIKIEEDGIAEYGGGRWGRDDDFQAGEMNDRSAIASSWRRLDGTPSPLTDLPVEEEEFSPPITFDEMEPDEEHFHEATGNEGASYERTYSRSALIVWPKDRVLSVINQAGTAVTLPFLDDLITRWTSGGDSAIRDQAAELARLIYDGWNFDRWYPRREDDGPGPAGRFLSALVRLGDTVRIDAFLTEFPRQRGFDLADATDIAAALAILPADRRATLAQALIEASVQSALSASAALLAGMALAEPAVAVGSARTLVAALPTKAQSDVWPRGPAVRPSFIADLFTALCRIGSVDRSGRVLAEAAADHVLAWPATYDFDSVLVPAAHLLIDKADNDAVRRLRLACLDHLDQRIALELAPPRDWRRPNALGCDCADCRALAAFLGNATQKDWVFAAAQQRRSHVEHTIRQAPADVSTVTEKRGSPHRLICTKTQASYLRRCEQRESDLAERARLAV